MNKAYKYRIYPNKSQKELMSRTFGSVRFIFNHILSDKKAHYEETGKSIKITPASYKNEYPWLKEVDSLALCNAQLNVDTAYRNFFRDKSVGYPKFKKKGQCRDSYTTNHVNGNISIGDKHIKLPKHGEIRIKKHRDIPDGYTLKSVTVSRTRSGKYFASVLIEYNEHIESIAIDSSKVLGVDFSMKELFVDSNAYEAGYPRYYRKAEERLAHMQRILSNCERGSNNRNKQRIKVARLHEKVANQRKDFLHKLSRQIANANDAVAVEDLNMQGMSQSLNFGKSVSDNGFGMFTVMLGYKLNEQGKALIKVDKFFPSTKTCSYCGKIKDMELSERIYECECGNVIDRDLNSAINIRNEALRMLSNDNKNRGAHGDSSLMLAPLGASNEKPPLQDFI